MRFTKEVILTHVSEYQIFRYYLGVDFKLGVAFRSPFRDERNPSFNIYKGENGSLYFKDFGSGEEGDCFDFIRLKYGITFPAALVMVGVDFDISSFEGKSDNYNNRRNMIRTYANKINLNLHVPDLDITIPEEEKRDIKEYEIIYDKMSDNWDVVRDYFVGKYGLDEKMMDDDEYDVSSPQIVRFISNAGKPIEIKSEPGNPIICYGSYGDKKSVRFYRPFATQYQLKHFGSIVKGDYFGAPVVKKEEYVDHASEIHIVFCAGQKDAMCVTKHFRNCIGIAMGSEGNKIPVDVLTNLYMLGYQHDNMFILYDNDKTGIERSIKLSKETNLQYVSMPEMLNKMSEIRNEYGISNCKDVADLCEYLIKNKQKVAIGMLNDYAKSALKMSPITV